MYIEHVPNRNSPPAILLRESYRDANKVKKRTLANLSSLPAEVIEGLKVLLRGGVAVPSVDDAFVLERSLPHGHGPAVTGADPDVGDAAARACGRRSHRRMPSRHGPGGGACLGGRAVVRRGAR